MKGLKQIIGRKRTERNFFGTVLFTFNPAAVPLSGRFALQQPAHSSLQSGLG